MVLNPGCPLPDTPAIFADEGVLRGVEETSGVQRGVGCSAARAYVRLHRLPVRHLFL